MKEPAPTGRIVLVVLAVLLVIAAGLGALLGVAALTSRPPLFLLAGLVGFCAVYLLGLLFATHKVGPDRRRRVREVSFFVGTALVVGLFVLTALLPMADPRLPPTPVEGQRFPRLRGRSRVGRPSGPHLQPHQASPALPKPAARTRLHGLGFFANQYPQSAARKPHRDFLPDLEELSIPTLVIKGRCDYLSWSSAQEYLNALPEAKLLYLNDSGHNACQDEPERYMANVRAFLLVRPLPESPYDGHRRPEDYEGPP